MAVQQKAKRDVSKQATQKRAPMKKTTGVKTASRSVASAKKTKTDAPAVASPKKSKPAHQTAKKTASIAKPANVLKSAARLHAKHVTEPAADVSTVMTKERKEEFAAHELEQFRKDLLAMHAHLTTQISKMRQNALTRDDEVNHEEDGSDAFDRLFTLERAGDGQKTIHKITTALRALQEGTYGVCEVCDGLIEYERLHALPFVKNCIACQSQLERKRSGNTSTARRNIP